MERRTRRLREPKLLNRQKSAREKSSSKWWSDPPKLIPILISLIAVTISCLGWWESHRGRLINEEINRPILTATSITMQRIGSLVFEKGSPYAYPIMIRITVKNVGKSSAVVQATNINFGMFPNDPAGCNSRIAVEESSSTTVLPGMESTFSQVVDLSNACLQKKEMAVDLNANVIYVDAGSGSQYKQHFSKLTVFSPMELSEDGNKLLGTPTPTSTPMPTPAPTSTR